VEDPLVGVVMVGFVELACEVAVVGNLGELTGDLADLGTMALLMDLNEECTFSSRAWSGIASDIFYFLNQGKKRHRVGLKKTINEDRKEKKEGRVFKDILGGLAMKKKKKFPERKKNKK
jgi:hypothetical protein